MLWNLLDFLFKQDQGLKKVFFFLYCSSEFFTFLLTNVKIRQSLRGQFCKPRHYRRLHENVYAFLNCKTLRLHLQLFQSKLKSKGENICCGAPLANGPFAELKFISHFRAITNNFYNSLRSIAVCYDDLFKILVS